MLFESWSGLGRVLWVGAAAYVGLIVMLRVSGNRTLSKLNAFDLIVTVALGSTLATVLLSRDVALVEGLVAFALLIGAQWAVTWLSCRSRTFSHWVKSDPTLLVYQGRFLPDAMRQARVIEEEVLAVLRGQGHAELAQVGAVVLETDGSISVLGEVGPSSQALRNVDRVEPAARG